MKLKTVFGYTLLVAGLTFTACSKEKGCTDDKASNYNSDAEEDDGSCAYDSTSADTSSTETNSSDTSNNNEGDSGNESSAAAGVLEKYDGTYNVTGDGHTRGTVIISNKGTKIDFDNGISYDIDDNNVYDRITAFNRYQIEFFDANNKQDRIRINLDPNDPNKVVGFEFDAGADEQDIITVTVQ